MGESQMSFPLAFKPTMVRSLSSEPKKEKRTPWKKPKSMPRRPLSAYNLFFQTQRKEMIAGLPKPVKKTSSKRRSRKVHGVGFADMARTIAKRWKGLEKTEKEPFEKQAKIEKDRYLAEMAVWRKAEKEKKGATPASPPTLSKVVTPNSGSPAVFDMPVKSYGRRLSTLSESTEVSRRLLHQMVTTVNPTSLLSLNSALLTPKRAPIDELSDIKFDSQQASECWSGSFCQQECSTPEVVEEAKNSEYLSFESQTSPSSDPLKSFEWSEQLEDLGDDDLDEIDESLFPDNTFSASDVVQHALDNDFLAPCDLDLHF